MRKTVLALACVLLAPVFLVGITASAPYEPWYDLDENGKIDIFDVVRIAGTYGTTGDPGKNVNVTNFPLDEQGNLLVSMAEQSPTEYVEAVEIAVVTTEVTGEMNVGIMLYNDTMYAFSFAFSPKGTVLNCGATAVIIYAGGGDGNTLDCSWVGGSESLETHNSAGHATAGQVYLGGVPEVEAGIYTVWLLYTGNDAFYLQKLTLLIEYRYMA